MVDINKYLNTQLALAKQRNNDRQCRKKQFVSEKSVSAAERILQKQDKTFTKSLCNTYENDMMLKNSESIIFAESTKFNFDGEYLPSCDNGDDKAVIGASQSRVKNDLKRIIDDGDRVLYKERISNWRNSLSAAKSNNFSVSYDSADIKYVLNENGDPEDVYEIQNGLRVPKFIWKQLYKYQKSGVKWLWELHQMQSGGMLGDEMGLGKTVQIIAFLAGLFRSDTGSWNGLGPSIIVAPATVIYQWVAHFHYWCPQLRVAVLHHTGSHSGNYKNLIKDICAARGILLISYAGIVKYTKNLLARNWHFIILDEGHKIRNPKTQVSKLVKKFHTPHKLLITGSPMQNSLQELWSLFDFMRPGLLGTCKVFMEHFAGPITQGGYANATELQKANALELAKALKNIITPHMLRRTKAEVQEHIKLPEKNEQVLFCALSKEQRDLYMGYLMSGIIKDILEKVEKYKGPIRAKVLVAISTLTKICNHPDLYLQEALGKLEGGEEFGHWKRSGKMSVVHSLLKLWDKQGHRTLIFTQSRAMIRILERYLQKYDFKYLKMDGTVSISQRQNLIKTFNGNREYLVFLSTTRVGGLGVNLTGADRVILYDPDWNPASDNQAKERAWRIGQKKNVTVYRLLSAGTIEEKIYQRQIFKSFLSNKVFINPNQKNVFTTSSLQGLFTLEDLNCDGDTETTSLFKHTKINVYNKEKNEKKHSGDTALLSEKKVAEMKKRAREISENISKSNSYKNVTTIKEKIRELENKRTDVPFDSVVSEIYIINKHTKKNYEENLMKQVLNNQIKETEEITMNDHIEKLGKQKEINLENDKKILEETPNQLEQCNSKQNRNLRKSKFDSSNRRMISSGLETAPVAKVVAPLKRKHSSLSEHDIRNLVSVKRVKNKRKKELNTNDDDYVLSKLFATETVKNALQHDMVGVAEKERKHRMKELAVENANKAVEAIKLSIK